MGHTSTLPDTKQTHSQHFFSLARRSVLLDSAAAMARLVRGQQSRSCVQHSDGLSILLLWKRSHHVSYQKTGPGRRQTLDRKLIKVIQFWYNEDAEDP